MNDVKETNAQSTRAIALDGIYSSRACTFDAAVIAVVLPLSLSSFRISSDSIRRCVSGRFKGAMCLGRKPETRMHSIMLNEFSQYRAVSHRKCQRRVTLAIRRYALANVQTFAVEQESTSTANHVSRHVLLHISRSCRNEKVHRRG